VATVLGLRLAEVAELLVVLICGVVFLAASPSLLLAD
jgi:hypothetical protein